MFICAYVRKSTNEYSYVNVVHVTDVLCLIFFYLCDKFSVFWYTIVTGEIYARKYICIKIKVSNGCKKNLYQYDVKCSMGTIDPF